MLNILIQAHLSYSYLDATIVQGFLNLGCNVFTTGSMHSYLSRKWCGEHIDLSIQCLKKAGRLPGDISVLTWGHDDNEGLDEETGFDAIFVREWDGRYEKINFGIEDRYIYPVKSSERTIDISFLGSLYPFRCELLDAVRRDFPDLTLQFGDRVYNTPDDTWSPHTLPYCVHDHEYFRTLGNSRIALSLWGAGKDCARTWEILASGAIPVIQRCSVVDPEPRVLWFETYEELKLQIETALGMDWRVENYEFNMKWHDTASRARYILERLGLWGA
jgi:hypothetical protein